MPTHEAPCVELGNAPDTTSEIASPSPSEISSASSPEPHNVRTTPLFRALAMPPPEPYQPPGQEDLERRLPGYRRIVIPRELTLIELLKEYSGARTDEEVLQIREAKLRVVAERVGLRRLHVLVPLLRSLTLDGSAVSSLRDLGIGLVHLKFLSVSRCSLTSLDGVWGFTVLKELHAAGNRIQDLQPLGALQKLNTLNLANNPITESSRVWTLGVCSSLRKLVLEGTPFAESLQYRSHVATLLPMLVYLDERPLHTDVEYDTEGLDVFINSDTDDEGQAHTAADSPESSNLQAEPEAGPSTATGADKHSSGTGVSDSNNQSHNKPSRRRPATTENVLGTRPARPKLPLRPQTAGNKTAADAPSKLQIFNTLMDDEWRCSGSRLTSQGAVCGNLARALRGRQSHTEHQPNSWQAELDLVEQNVQEASRALAEEIPRAPRLEDWEAFRLNTGIDIEINFNERIHGDALKAIERLEQIEKETRERLKGQDQKPKVTRSNVELGTKCEGEMPSVSICELSQEINSLSINEHGTNTVRQTTTHILIHN